MEVDLAEHILVTIGKKRFEDKKRVSVHFVDNEEQNSFINDIENVPHAYVLACLMDRQIKAERAWSIPYKIKEIVGDFSINSLSNISLDEYKLMFKENSFHRFNDVMADVFLSGVNEIKEKYDGDVSRIWANNPSSAKVVYDFLQFKGSGKK